MDIYLAPIQHAALVCVYREAGRVDNLCTVGTFHQSEGGVSSFLLVGLLADLAHCRQRKTRLEEADIYHTYQTHLQIIL